MGASAAFLLYLQRALGIAPLLAGTVTLIAWISPHLWRVAMIPLSEPLFLLFLLLALWAGARMERRKGWGPLALFLLAAAAASYTRSLGVAVILAGVLSLGSSGRRRASLGVAVGGAALLAPWFLWSHRAAESIPAPLLDTLGPYAGWWGRQALADPAAYLQRTLANASALGREGLSMVLPGANGALLWLGVLLVPPFVLGLIELSRRTRVLGLTLGIASAILLVWPFQAIRLLVPFEPILILVVAVGFRSLWRLSAKRKGSHVGVGILSLAWALLVLSVSGLRLAEGWPGREYRARARALMDAVEAVREETPEDAVVGAPELWAAIHLFTGRLVVPSARFTRGPGGAPTAGTPEEQLELWVESGVTHLILEQGGAIHGAALARLEALCSPGSVEVLDRRPGALLVALNWDSNCRGRALGMPMGGPPVGDEGTLGLRLTLPTGSPPDRSFGG